MKKIITALLSMVMTLCLCTACDALSRFVGGGSSSSSSSSTVNPDDNNGGDNSGDNGLGDNAGDGGSGNSGNGSGNSGNGSGDNAGDGGSGDSGNSGSGNVDTTAQVILEAAYALASGETLAGTHTLTGLVTDIEKVGDGTNDVCLTMVVDGFDDMPMYCFWLQDAADQVSEGDTITVSGSIKNHNGTVEYFKPTLVDVVGGSGSGNSGSGDGSGDSGTGSGNSGSGSVGTDAQSILQAAYALADGETLAGTHTLTGKVTDIAKVDQGDTCLTLVVDGFANMPMYCYWLQDVDNLTVGDVITVTGTIKNHGGTVEYFKPTLVEIVSSGSGSGDSGSGDSGSGDSGNSGSGSGSSSYTYTDFTASEKEIFQNGVGEVIPFIANNDYVVETGSDEYGTLYYFYTFGNTQAEFDAYRAQYISAGYTLDGTEPDEDGDTWYFYSKGDILVDMVYYSYEGENVVYACVYLDTESGSDDSDTGSGTGSVGTDAQSILEAAYALASGETLAGTHKLTGVVTDIEKVGDGTNDVCLTMVVDGFDDMPIYCFWLQDAADQVSEGDTITVSGSIKNYNGTVEYVKPALVDVVGGTGGGNSGSGETDLPTGENGVYAVDFTRATNVKNVTDQGYYLGGCPTMGQPKVLVVPVQFSDVTAASKGYTIETIEKAFNGTGNDTDYYSVREYYSISSYGQLDLQFTVLDSWFTPQYESSYYLDYTIDYYGEQVEGGDQLIMDEVLKSLSGSMDLSQFDSDNNGYIDAIVFINTLEINYDVTMQWAYRYWNIYGDENDEYYEYDGVVANDYLWASYQFLFDDGEDFTDTSAMNTYTYIHEFGHVLGADDYYDTSYEGNAPMGGYDVMDSMAGDHNAYTKFNYGWVTTSRLVVAEESVTLTLDAFAKDGDSIIIARNWDETLGAYQEYFVLLYYTNEGLNSGNGGYFNEEGIVVYHVNATLYTETIDGETYYDVQNNNTDASDDSGTEDNLIELVESTSGNFVYTVGSSISANTKDDNNQKIAYTFTVDALTADSATITFTKNA